jgi:hypothetical protein
MAASAVQTLDDGGMTGVHMIAHEP